MKWNYKQWLIDTIQQQQKKKKKKTIFNNENDNNYQCHMGVSFMLNTFEVKKNSKYNIFLLLPSASIGSKLDVRASIHVLMRISA